MDLHTANITAGAMQQASLPEDAINLNFAITGAAISYVHGLPPMTGVSGSAQLTGDTFKGQIKSANVGPLAVSNAQVLIAGLHIPSVPANITARITGQLVDVLKLIDMKPLQYPTKFHLSPDSARGTTSSDLSFKVPTTHDVSIDQIAIGVKTQFNNLALQHRPAYQGDQRHRHDHGGQQAAPRNRQRLREQCAAQRRLDGSVRE